MKKLTAVMGLVLASTASAQTWDAGDGKLTLVGCYGKQDGVYCDFSYTLTKKQTASLYWNQQYFKVFRQDGEAYVADGVSFAGGKFTNSIYGNTDSKEIIANVPVKLQIYFNIPNSTASFRALAYNDVRADNIPIRPYGSAPTTPAPLPAGSDIKGFSVSLSNCQLQGQNYICTATLTPTK